MRPIRANSILPARRRPLMLYTSDGVNLVGEVALPQIGEPTGTVVCLHPLTVQEGSADSHVLRKMSWRLPALTGLAVLRFNFRGATSSLGASGGSWDMARKEGLDLAAALREVRRLRLPDPWLVGWSFGTDVILKHGNVDPVQGAILLSPPLRWSLDPDLDGWAESGRPLLALIPEHDDFLRPEEARRRFARIPQARVEAVEGAQHLWVGEPYVRIVLNRIVAEVLPHFPLPLPTEYAGPMTTWSAP